MNIYLLLGHNDTHSFNGQLADAYEKSALLRGHQVRRQNIGEMVFDPILKKEIATNKLEPDIQSARDNIMWCNRWVIFYPLWWGSLPALLKGYIDRTLTSGFAYKYHTHGIGWDKLLSGRSAHIISTCDAPGFWIYFQYRNSDINTIKRATLEFCGVNPVEVTRITRVRFLTPEQREHWIDRMQTVVPT